FVIGALFRRERANPGPRFQVSSDAASALDMLAGAPAQLNVTALRREEVPNGNLAAAPAIESSELPQAQTGEAMAPVVEVAAPAAPPPPVLPREAMLDKSYIQIGIFSVENNANNTATAMRTDGMVPLIKKQSTAGKTFWRVLVGPAANSA